jgi:dCMP deaminase
MAIARAVAERSTCSRKTKVGAVLVDGDGFLVASGYNGAPSGQTHCDDEGCVKDVNGKCVRAVHAELNALLQCARRGAGSEGCTAYVTHFPCPRCAQALAQAGVAKVVYGEVSIHGAEYEQAAAFLAESGTETKGASGA